MLARFVVDAGNQRGLCFPGVDCNLRHLLDGLQQGTLCVRANNRGTQPPMKANTAKQPLRMPTTTQSQRHSLLRTAASA